MAHNGNLTNTHELVKDVYREDLRHVNTNSDSEVLLNVFAHELHEQKKLVPTADDVFEAVKRVHKRVEGGYAAIALISGYGVVGFRDPKWYSPGSIW